jgi:MFS family permease
MLTTTTFGLGLMSFIDNANTFKYVGIAIRFFMGQGDILLQITCYTVITSIFSDNVMKYISYIELVVGMGLALGPAIGSVVYGFLNYDGTMYFFGGLNTIAMLCCWFFIPNELNKTVSYEEIAEFEAELEDVDPDAISNKQKIKITWGTVLGNKHVVFSLLTCFFGTYNLVFFAGYLAEYLTSLNFNENNVGYVMAC